ncbi:acyltransferase [Vibrio cholerae]|uniref:acyltransferase n=1 Tax=Vibrio cholerae TaxID=666 RepID=UPI002271AF48|nr:acyltransferase [Vibrio cholerae]MCX9449919.1 acyltransferase [Vibrio cholerae]
MSFLILKLYRFKYFLQKISGTVVYGKNVSLHYFGNFLVFKNKNLNAKIVLGDDVYVGKFFDLHTSSKITLSDGVVLSDYVYMSTVAHGISPRDGFIMKQDWYDRGEIYIGENSFIGHGAKVFGNVTLGEWCIVGAGSIVTKSFPSFSMIAGNPARLIKKYNNETNCWESVSDIE